MIRSYSVASKQKMVRQMTVKNAVSATQFAREIGVRQQNFSRRPSGQVNRDQSVAPQSWMQRLKRVFAIDIETSPDCGGKLRIIACIEDPPLIAKILEHVRSREAGAVMQARAPTADLQQVLSLI